MEYITAVNNYIVVEPSGNVKGFKEVSDARGYISSIYLTNILSYKPYRDSYGSYYDIYQEEDQEALNLISGVDEGECRIFDLDSVISNIRDKPFFQEEKDELIKLLLQENIHLNIYDYGIDDVLLDCKEIWSV